MAHEDFSRLTTGESLLIARRRSGESQELMAKKYGITRNQYGRAERDQEDCVKDVPVIQDLDLKEKCLLLRRRAEKTQEECAEEMSITRFWFNQMEMGNINNDDLIRYWGLSE